MLGRVAAHAVADAVTDAVVVSLAVATAVAAQDEVGMKHSAGLGLPFCI